MARRSRKKQKKSSSLSSSVILIAGSLGVVGVIVVAYLVLTEPRSPSAPTLNAQTYVDSPKSILGDSFSFKGEVIKLIHYEEGVSRIYNVLYDNNHIPIEVPESVDGPNINTQQEYTFFVNAKKNEWLVATAYSDK